MLYDHRQWSDYFNDDKISALGLFNSFKTINIANQQNNYISNTIFSKLSNRAIFCSNLALSLKLLIEVCHFSSCSSSLNGGAIHFYSLGHIVQNRILSESCKTQIGIGCHSFSNVTLNSLNKNYLLESSISYAKADLYGAPVYFVGGSFQIKSGNVSFCRSVNHGGFSCFSANSMAVEFTNVQNNSVSIDAICVFGSSIDGTMNYSNVINNSAASRGIIFASFNSNFTKCNIIDNIERATSFLFETEKSTLFNCFVSNPLADKNNGRVIIESSYDDVVNFDIKNINDLFDMENLFHTHKNCITVCQNYPFYSRMNIFVFILLVTN